MHLSVQFYHAQRQHKATIKVAFTAGIKREESFVPNKTPTAAARSRAAAVVAWPSELGGDVFVRAEAV